MFGRIRLKACAKINLCLDIIGTRSDGYHLLETVMQSVELHDTVSVSRRGSGICVKCRGLAIPQEKNLAYKAAVQFYKQTGISENSGAVIKIKKRIPSQAGLGGGSADAAATLVALNKLYKTKLSDEKLCKIGESVGADVPFCICGGTRLVRGVGEIMTKIEDIYNCSIVVVKGKDGVSTEQAYKAFDESGKTVSLRTEKIIEAISEGNFKALKGRLVNAFQLSCPDSEASQITDELKKAGAVEAVMTGSGSAVFGIFTSCSQAKRCVCEMKKRYPFVCITRPSVKGILR